MSDNNNDFLKNTDVRAGKIPGWRSKPETNGDPYDSQNMERTDASMVVTDGMTMRNAASMYVTKIVGQRRLLSLAISVAVFGYGANLLYNSYGPGHGVSQTSSTVQAPSTQPRSQYNSGSTSVGNSSAPVEEEDHGTNDYKPGDDEPAKPSKTPDSVNAIKLIEKHYINQVDGVSKAYDTKFFSKFGWPVKGYDWSINSYSWNKFNNEFKNGSLKSIADQVPEFCSGLTLSECLPKMSDQMAFAALAYAGENMDMYGSSRGDMMDDTKKPVEKLETALADFNKAFSERKAALEKEGQPMPNYCDSPNRRFADTWGINQASANLSILQRSWEEDKKIPYNEHIVKVGSMKELIALRKDGDKKCNNINIAVLPVDSGALKYIINMSVRTHNSNGDNIATGLYFLGQLDKGRVISLIATNNSANAPLFNQQTASSNMSSILPGLNIASSEVVSLFEKSDYSLVDKNNTNTTQGE